MVSISIPRKTRDMASPSIFSGATGKPRSSHVAREVDNADWQAME